MHLWRPIEDIGEDGGEEKGEGYCTCDCTVRVKTLKLGKINELPTCRVNDQRPGKFRGYYYGMIACCIR